MSQAPSLKQLQTGISMMEMLIALAVVGILVAVAMPSMSDFGIKHKLIGAAEQVYGHLQQARSDAIASSALTYANFAATGTTTWQYGVSTTNNCNLAITAAATANACVIVVNDGDATTDGVNGTDTDDRVLMRFTDADYTGNNAVEMAVSGLGGGSQFIFDPVRGTLGTAAGQVDLESTTGLQLRVRASALGRISICSPGGSVANYEVC